MKKLQTLIILLICFSQLMAQYYKSDSVSKKEITKLGFIAGEWEGEGWMMMPNGKKYPFHQTEHIQFKLDSTILLIEGLGKAHGEIIHNALAVVSYNKEKTEYAFRSYLQNGHSNTFKGELTDNTFVWYPNSGMRYQIWITEEGNWMEIGERKQEEEWIQFFEMELAPVSKERD